MKRVLIFPSRISGGVGSVVMNIFRHIDRAEFIIDFCVSDSDQGYYDKEILKTGSRIIRIPQIRKVGILKYISAIIKVIEENGPYDVAHIHSVHVGALTMIAARIAGIKSLIYHVHNTKDAALEHLKCHRLIEVIMKHVIVYLSTVKLACGRDAGVYIYGKNATFKVINNAIDLNRFFPYSKEEYLNIRHKLGIKKNCIVVGNVAAFVKEKNQSFFINLANEDLQNGNRIVFLLVGNGPMLDSLKHQVSLHKNIEDKFIFTGKRMDVETLYNAMDVFCLPSLYEGLPVSVIEAQACGLPIVTSDAVTQEANLGVTRYSRISLNTSASKWIEEIYDSSNYKLKETQYILKQFKRKGYEVISCMNEIYDIYKR